MMGISVSGTHPFHPMYGRDFEFVAYRQNWGEDRVHLHDENGQPSRARIVTRHWRPVIFLAVVMFGELGAFLTIADIVKRPRPNVPHLDSHLPTSAFPSGHMAATTCLYVGIAILVIGHARGWWRYLFLIPAIVMPLMIATARLYRGEHHTTDILASVLFAALWLTATTMLIKPNADGLDRAGRRPLGLPHRKAAHRSRETAPATR